MGIAVDFACRCLQNARAASLRQFEHVDGAMNICLDRLDRIVLIMDRRGGTCEIIDFIGLDIDALADIVLDQLKRRIFQEGKGIRAASGEEIIATDDRMPFLKEPLAEMRAKKTGTAGD